MLYLSRYLAKLHETSARPQTRNDLAAKIIIAADSAAAPEAAAILTRMSEMSPISSTLSRSEKLAKSDWEPLDKVTFTYTHLISGLL